MGTLPDRPAAVIAARGSGPENVRPSRRPRVPSLRVARALTSREPSESRRLACATIYGPAEAFRSRSGRARVRYSASILHASCKHDALRARKQGARRRQRLHPAGAEGLIASHQHQEEKGAGPSLRENMRNADRREEARSPYNWRAGPTATSPRAPTPAAPCLLLAPSLSLPAAAARPFLVLCPLLRHTRILLAPTSPH
jgi:hypothetical protein